MSMTIRDSKTWHNRHGGFCTRQDAALHLTLSDGSHIDRIMAGYPVLCMPRKDGKQARMYHKSDVFDVMQKRRKRGQNAPELFTAATIRKTARDKRKAQQDADIRTLINMGGGK